MERAGKDWRDRDYFEGEPLRPATHPHPGFMIPWLEKRGHVNARRHEQP